MTGTAGLSLSLGVAIFAPAEAAAYDAIDCRQDCVENANDQLLNINCSGDDWAWCQEIQWESLRCEDECDRLFEGDDGFDDFFGIESVPKHTLGSKRLK
jgi:hypothetical protein